MIDMPLPRSILSHTSTVRIKATPTLNNAKIKHLAKG